MVLESVIMWGLGVLTLLGGVVARDRYIGAAIVTGDRAVREELDKKVGAIHTRINETRDDFVRRDDLDGHLGRMEKTMLVMHEEQKETNKRIDTFMAEMVQYGKHK